MKLLQNNSTVYGLGRTLPSLNTMKNKTNMYAEMQQIRCWPAKSGQWSFDVIDGRKLLCRSPTLGCSLLLRSNHRLIANTYCTLVFTREWHSNVSCGQKSGNYRGNGEMCVITAV